MAESIFHILQIYSISYLVQYKKWQGWRFTRNLSHYFVCRLRLILIFENEIEHNL